MVIDLVFYFLNLFQVVNGDVEDPYNRDSDTDLARSDAEAIRREKSRRNDDNRGTKKKHKMRRARSDPESESDHDVRILFLK